MNPLYPHTASGTPSDAIEMRPTRAPSLGDADGDGVLDVPTGQPQGGLPAVQALSPAVTPVYIGLTGAANPFAGLGASRFGYSSPSFGDFDDDGDLDLVVGDLNSTLYYFRNTGSDTAPAYAEQFGPANPFSGFFGSPDSQGATSAGDVDGDGDLDLVVGRFDGRLRYFEDTGSTYAERTGAANPFNGVTTTAAARPSLADIDGDGDVDLLVGDLQGGLKHYENTGTGTSGVPIYVLRGPDSPFANVNLGMGGLYSAPALGDVDGDHDLDLVLGEFFGRVRYFENTGTASAPSYVQRTGAANPYNSIDVGFYSQPSLGDIDGDGDLDLVSGNTEGELFTFIQNDAPTLSVSSFALGGTDEDRTSTPVTVASLLASAGGADSDARALKGIAVTGSIGAGWQYSVDGISWSPLGVTSNTAALLLGDTTQLRYEPDRINGETATLSFRAWDQTSASASTASTRMSADASSNGGGTAFSTLASTGSLVVASVNDAPVAVNDTAQAGAAGPGGAVNIPVLANDSDIDGGPLGVSAVTQGSGGSVGIRSDGVSVRYTPNAGFSGFDTFTYTVSDGFGGTAVGTVRVLVPGYVGTAGNDVSLGTPQADFILAGDGNDRVLAYGGDDYVEGGRGADTLSGGPGADTLLGGDGTDTFLTTAADLAGDSIDGGNQTDTLQITDPIAVMPAVFTVVNVEQLSFPGSLQVGHTSLLDLSAMTLSGAGNQINGGTAATRIIGTRSNDRITDSAGNDDLRGADGHDTIMAGVGQDTVYGGTGNDTLGGSASTLGDGAIDTFVFNTALNAATNVDTLIAFEANSRDLIALDSAIFSAIGTALDATEFRSAPGGLAADANDFILYDTSTGALYYDADGSGAGPRVQFATLGAGLSGTVDFSDFLIGSFPG